MTTMDIIGRTTEIDIPDYGLLGVPAKIDTGADASAIWASNITEAAGTLQFVLFGPGSRYYTGEPITTTDYTSVTIKNSFGQAETRYKIKTVVRINGHKIRIAFTLADRSQQRYSVLIGKATLRGKFLVNVARRARSNQPARLLILSSRRKGSALQLEKALQTEFGSEATVAIRTFDELAFHITSDSYEVIDLVSDVALDQYDLVYFRTYFAFAEKAGATADYLTAHKIPFVDREVAHYHSKTKLTQYIRLSRAGLPFPDSMLVGMHQLASSYELLAERLGLPFICKDINAEHGDNNYLISNPAEFAACAALAADRPEVSLIAQAYVPNDRDLRVLVFGRTPELVIERRTIEGSHLSNTSKGGQAQLIPLGDCDSAMLTVAAQAATVMNRQVVGVDLMQSRRDGHWYILEVNNSPQISSGAFTAEKMHHLAVYLRRQLRKTT